MLTSGPGKISCPNFFRSGIRCRQNAFAACGGFRTGNCPGFFLPVPGWSSAGIRAASCGKYDILETLKLNNRFLYIFNCTWSAWADLRDILWGAPLNDAFWSQIIPEVIAAIFVGIMVTFLLPSSQQVIGPGFLWRRLKQGD